MDARQPAADEPTVVVHAHARYSRDWLIAAGSVIPLIGVAFPSYLAWRDDRQRWVRACALLVVAAVACFPLSDAGDSVDGAAIGVVWLAAIIFAIVLASTVSPEDRRASTEELAARRRVARFTRRLATAAIDPQDSRPRGGTALTEPIVRITGFHRSTYEVQDRDGGRLGVIQTAADRCPADFRARYELLAPDGSRVLSMMIAQRSGGHPDVILSADDTELVRLQPAGRDDGPFVPETPRFRPFGRLGFGSRWLFSGEERVGQVRRSDKRRPTAVRVVTDAHGAEVARVVRVGGGAGPSGTEREFVIDLSEGADDRRSSRRRARRRPVGLVHHLLGRRRRIERHSGEGTGSGLGRAATARVLSGR